MQNNQLFSIRQAAEYLGVHIETLRRWDREGKLTAVRVGQSSHRRYKTETLESFKNGNFKSKSDDANFPSSIYADRIIDFHSTAITDEGYFARIVLSIAERVEKFIDCELIDGPNDKKRDILCYKISRYNKRRPIYIQCKHVKDITEGILKEEIDGLSKHITNKIIPKPIKIYFALSSNVNATIRDNIRLYAEQLLGISSQNVVFWCPAELDSKIKSDASILNQFIHTGQLNNIKYINEKSPDIKPEYESIKRNLTRSVQLIQGKQFKEAEEKLLLLLGSVPEKEEYSEERAKIYNNLGLCYKWDGNNTNNYQKAIDSFNKALDLDPDFIKAKCNLVNTLLLTQNSGNDKKAWEIINKLHNDLGLEDEFVNITYIQTYSIKFGKEEAIEEYKRIENELKIKGKIQAVDNYGFWHFLATTYFFIDNLEKSQEYLNKVLEENQYDVDAAYLSAMIKMNKAKKNTDSVEDFIDNFKSSQEIREVEKQLKNVYKLAKEESRNDLLPEIFHNWNVCKLWLWKTTGEKLEELDYPLPESTRIDDSKISKIPDKLLNKDYEGAYNAYKELGQSNFFSSNDKFRIARIFQIYGYPEISLRILDDIEIQPNTNITYNYWLFKSICQVLTGEKGLAIESCNKAKETSKTNENDIQTVLSHTGALLMRYQKEGDRILQNAIEYDNAFPTKQSLIKLNINNETDKDFIIKSMVDKKQWFDNLLDIYKKNPVIVYFLEKSFNRPFIELWAGRGINFPWEYHTPSNDYKNHLVKLLNSSECLIFDYISLLTLVKANLLSFVERSNKKIYVHKFTFDKIQEELIQYENDTLRKLWDYLRKSSLVTFISSNEKLDEEVSKLSGVFDSWLLQSIQVAKLNKYLFVTDDLRLSKAFKSVGIESINSLTFLLNAYDKKQIAKKDYSQILGDIADCVYSFLPFNYEDLLEIIWIDDYKLSRRSYHLIHQIFLTGADITSFVNVFIEFIQSLWKSGALSTDKIFWLRFITEEISLLFKKWEDEKVPVTDEGKEFINKFALMWSSAIQNGTIDDLNALKIDIEAVSYDSLVYKIRDTVMKHIEMRSAELERG